MVLNPCTHKLEDQEKKNDIIRSIIVYFVSLAAQIKATEREMWQVWASKEKNTQCLWCLNTYIMTGCHIAETDVLSNLVC